ncbi:transposase IS116/IS110/IS902 family protein [Methylocaldum marinum]|uniref:Transposase IS116/IS110/IS902 family protein n=1 Tax=Methylocaldum marinum TaxID=1432792 RepID=A0A250KSM3_9GAMM|nr:IS110 family transposase [Methylocaldum marinum]BBA34514.1 transposase IS116/IS110/IS902 family protein [Methylocaldum marinum]
MTFTPIGIDIAKAKFDAAALRNGKYKTKVFQNTPEGFKAFLAWLQAFPAPHVCLEATGRYGEGLALFLVDHGLAVSVVNPAQIHAFGKAELSRTKTDKTDAKLIARFCHSQRPLLWQPPPPAVRPLQALVRRLESLLEMRQMEKNRLDGADPTVRPSIEAVLATLDAEIAATQKRIREHIDHDPDLRQRRDLIDTIPGLSDATIPVLLAALGDVHRFENARSVAAFAGLSPKEHQSGKWKGHTRLSKTGDALLRKALYMPAIVARRHNPLIRAFCERLKAQGKNGKLIVGAAMRKLLVLAYGVLKSGQPFNPNHGLAS